MGKEKSIHPKSEISKLLRGGKLSEEELKFIDQWYYSSKTEEKEIRNALEPIDPGRILQNIHLQTGIGSHNKQRNLRTYFSIAAAFLLLLLAGWAIIPRYFLSESSNFEANLKIVETASGERKKGVLPDGSIVFLKENSSISYQENFENGRAVKVEGEVFFKVEKSPTDIFSVKQNHLETKVLGTEFLVSDKRNSSEMVIVKSGKVSVADLEGKEVPVILEKNGKAKWSKVEEKIKVTSVSNEEKYFSWIEGTLVIDRANISQLAEELENWFGIEVENLAEVNECLFSGAYHKMSIEQVLETINYSVNLNYEYYENKLIIKSMRCK